MRPHLYLIELVIAALFVGADTLLMHRVFDVMEIQAFFASLVAVALGLAVFWIYFVPRAHRPHQRWLSLATSLIVGMGFAPWVVAPVTNHLFASRSQMGRLYDPLTSIERSSGRNSNRAVIYSHNYEMPMLSKSHAEAFRKKLLNDGFRAIERGRTTWYKRGNIAIQLFVINDGFDADYGWQAEGFWFQVNAAQAEADQYRNELQNWRDTNCFKEASP